MATINYENLPSTNTPLNATNLNDMQDIVSSVPLGTYLENSWAANGYCQVNKIKNVIFLTLSVRYGTAAKILTLPSGYRPSSTIILPSYNGSTGNYVVIATNGNITVSDSSQIGANVVFTTSYT